MADRTYQCPECERKPFPTIGGWKRHMSATHQGYTTDQLNDIIGSGDEGVALAGGESLEDAINNLPLTEHDGAAAQQQETQQSREQTKEMKAAAKRIKMRFDNLKNTVSSDVPKQAFKAAGIELTEKESNWLSESIQTSFDVFGINFEVEPLNFTIRNPFWVILYPIMVIAFIVFGKIMEQKKQGSGDDNNPDLPPPVTL